MSIIMRWVANDYVNVRSGPGLRFPVEYRLVRGDPITFDDSATVVVADSHQWMRRAKLEYNTHWVAADVLTSKDPTRPDNPLKIGFHVLMYNYDPNALIRLLLQMYNAGRPMPVITVLGPGELKISRIKAASPTTKVYFRYVRDSDGGFDMDAPRFFSTFVDPGFVDRQLVDFFLINNEVARFDKDAIDWWTAQMKWAEAHGHKLGVPIWPTGNPGGDPMDTWGRPYILEFMRYVRDHGHRLVLHEYFRGDADWDLFRFADHVYPHLPDDLKNNMPKVMFSEWGRDNLAYYSPEALLSLFKLEQARLAQEPWCEGVCYYTCGDSITQWQGFNYAKNMAVVAQA